MSKLDEVYSRLNTNKKRRSEIQKMIKDELSHNQRYQELKEEMKDLGDEKKMIEEEVRSSGSEGRELDDLKLEIQTDQELLSDIALTMYSKNETVEIVDEYDQSWYPVFKVSFKKQ